MGIICSFWLYIIFLINYLLVTKNKQKFDLPIYISISSNKIHMSLDKTKSDYDILTELCKYAKYHYGSNYTNGYGGSYIDTNKPDNAKPNPLCSLDITIEDKYDLNFDLKAQEYFIDIIKESIIHTLSKNKFFFLMMKSCEMPPPNLEAYIIKSDIQIINDKQMRLFKFIFPKVKFNNDMMSEITNWVISNTLFKDIPEDFVYKISWAYNWVY